jgi:hypothetical protein
MMPGILWLGRRFPIGRRNWVRLVAFHLLLGVGVTVAQLVLEGAILSRLGVFPAHPPGRAARWSAPDSNRLTGSDHGRWIGHLRLICNPVHFRSLASILREGLFKVGRTRDHICPDKSNKDAFSIQRAIHGANLAVCPIETPLVGLRIETEGQTFDAAGSRAIGFELFQLGTTGPKLSGDGSTVKLDPGGGSSQGMQEALKVNLPSAHLEVKIVLTAMIVVARIWLDGRLRSRCDGILDCFTVLPSFEFDCA